MTKENAQLAMWWGLTFLFVVGGMALSYALWRAGRLLKELQESLHEATDEVVPVIAKAGESVDAINQQLRKVDLMMDSAVDAVEAADVAVRAVSMAVTEPVKLATGAVAGVTEAVTSFRARMERDDSSVDEEKLESVVGAAVDAATVAAENALSSRRRQKKRGKSRDDASGNSGEWV